MVPGHIHRSLRESRGRVSRTVVAVLLVAGIAAAVWIERRAAHEGEMEKARLEAERSAATRGKAGRPADAPEADSYRDRPGRERGERSGGREKGGGATK
jgi:hypothetical protein